MLDKISVECVDLECENGREELRKALVGESRLGVRKDSVLKVDLKRCSNNGKVIRVEGRIEQKLVNIGEGYVVFYSNISNSKLENFTISKYVYI